MASGKLLIFSAPSGSGKTTIVRHLEKTNIDLEFSISACTRDRRGRKEKHGKDYYFYTPDEFRDMIDRQEFVEWEEVYPGAYYGTLKREIDRIWDKSHHVIFDVDVKGGLNLKKAYGKKALSIFVKVPSLDVLEERLRSRGTESEDNISQRLFKAKFEMGFMDEFDVILENDDLDKTLAKAQAIYDQFKNS